MTPNTNFHGEYPHTKYIRLFFQTKQLFSKASKDAFYFNRIHPFLQNFWCKNPLPLHHWWNSHHSLLQQIICKLPVLNLHQEAFYILTLLPTLPLLPPVPGVSVLTQLQALLSTQTHSTNHHSLLHPTHSHLQVPHKHNTTTTTFIKYTNTTTHHFSFPTTTPSPQTTSSQNQMEEEIMEHDHEDVMELTTGKYNRAETLPWDLYVPVI